MKITIAMALLALYLTTPAALSWADEDKDHVCFRVLDTDGNGIVTRQEFEKVYEQGSQKFDQADADKDGELTHDEYHAMLGHGAPEG
jgi:hypothetical protein